jgi:hypothetical protein
MGKFVIIQRRNGEYQFNLVAQNGRIILTSEGYITLAACQNGIQSVKINSVNDQRYQRKISMNGKAYFTLIASNGQIIGSSEMYESTASRDHSIDLIKELALKATVEPASRLRPCAV